MQVFRFWRFLFYFNTLYKRYWIHSICFDSCRV